MRYLWLAFLIGWSGSTYAAVGTSPSVDVPIIISPSGPTPPAGAVAAGFTTLAANDDFTQTLPANWLDCYPSDGQTHRWYQGLWFHSNEVPCSAIQQVSDPATGSTVLDLRWQASYGSAGTGLTQMTTMSHDTTKVTDFGNAYFEMTARITPLPGDSSNGPLTAFWSWGTDSARGGGGPIEWDYLEQYGASPACCDAGIHNWGNSDRGTQFIWVGSGALPAGFDFTQYHTYGFRITSDGSTRMSGCSYIDGSLIRCADPQAVGPEFNSRSFLIVNNGRIAATYPDTTHFYIKDIRVWSCANWQTTMCNGTVLSGAP